LCINQWRSNADEIIDSFFFDTISSSIHVSENSIARSPVRLKSQLCGSYLVRSLECVAATNCGIFPQEAGPVMDGCLAYELSPQLVASDFFSHFRLKRMHFADCVRDATRSTAVLLDGFNETLGDTG
ncbi:hypothetical protein RZS08_38270, partial [Arthrospira platensis SPKY1]|nr:hypothetical protein [Arthrospira platensis SPKY1]